MSKRSRRGGRGSRSDSSDSGGYHRRRRQGGGNYQRSRVAAERGERRRHGERDREDITRNRTRTTREETPRGQRPPTGKLTARTVLSPAERAVSVLELKESDEWLDVVLKETAIVRANKETGQLMLDSGGWRTFSTLGGINAALRPLRLMVVERMGENMVEGGEWEVRAYAAGPPSTKPSQGFGKATVSGIQEFDDQMTVEILTPTKPQRQGIASIIKQHLTQSQLSLRARLRYGKRPPTEVCISDKYFVSTV